MADIRKHIVVSKKIKREFDLCKKVHAPYISTEGFVKFLIDTCHWAHCPECRGLLETKACSCKASDRQ